MPLNIVTDIEKDNLNQKIKDYENNVNSLNNQIKDYENEGNRLNNILNGFEEIYDYDVKDIEEKDTALKKYESDIKKLQQDIEYYEMFWTNSAVLC